MKHVLGKLSTKYSLHHKSKNLNHYRVFFPKTTSVKAKYEKACHALNNITGRSRWFWCRLITWNKFFWSSPIFCWRALFVSLSNKYLSSCWERSNSASTWSTNQLRKLKNWFIEVLLPKKKTDLFYYFYLHTFTFLLKM